MKKKKNKGFTLIELLAVIIILGILMIIAIPSITKFISGSRQDAYIETAKEVVKGAINLVNSGELQMRDIDATYYMPSTCIHTENGSSAKSPYGEFQPAYVVINYNGSGNGYDYYWMSRDETGTGVKTPIGIDELDTDDIESDITEQDFIDGITTIDKRKKFLFFNADCTSKDDRKPSSFGSLLPVNECTYDGLMSVGAEYTNGQYTYRFRQESSGMNGDTNTWTNIEPEGWGVVLTNKNSTAPVNTKICTSINGKPIVSMQYMFFNSKAASIDVISFDTSHVTNMSEMFMNATGVKELDLSRFDTSKLNRFYSMFYGATSLESLNMDNWNFINAGGSSSGGGSLATTPSLKTISARNWVIPSTFTHVFSRTWSGISSPIETIDVTGWDLSKANDISGIFGNSGSLKTIIGLDTWNTSKIMSMQNIFGECRSLTEVNMDNWDLSKIGNASNGSGMFSGATSLKTISARNWKLPSTFADVFSRHWSGSAIETIDVTGWDLTKARNLNGLFGSSGKLKNIIGIDTWDTSGVTDIGNMFSGCSSIETLDLSTFNTSKVTNYVSMFYGCSSLKSLNMDGWDLRKTSGSTAGGGLTSGASSLKTISVKNWKLPQTFTHVFSRTWGGSSPVETIDVTGWDLSNTTDIQGLFGDCYQLKKIIGMDTWDTSTITSFNNFFYNCYRLTDYDISHFDTRNVTDMTVMFYNNQDITSIDLSTFRTPKLTSYSAMFSGCSSLISLNLDNWDLSRTSGSGSGGSLTSGASSLKTISARNWKLPQYFTHVFSRTWGGSSPVETIDVTGWDLSNTVDIQGLFGDCNYLKKIIGMDTWNTSTITSFNNFFYNCYRLTDYDISHFNTSNVTDMTVMFYNNQDITSIDLSTFRTPKLTSYSAMFSGCSNLTSLNMDNWDISKAGISGGHLSGCTKLKTLSVKNWKLPQSVTHWVSRSWNGGGSPIETIDVTGWDLTNTTSLNGVFGDSKYLKTITGLNTWNTQNVSDMGNMFYGCSTLESLDLSSLNTSNVTNMYGMFSYCSNLSNINVLGFDTNKVTNMTAMFSGCSKLSTLDLSSFDLTQISESNLGGMLSGCSSLTTGYAKSVANANILNNSTYVSKPSGATFTVK